MKTIAKQIPGKQIFYDMVDEDLLNRLSEEYPNHSFNLVPNGSTLNNYTCAWIVKDDGGGAARKI